MSPKKRRPKKKKSKKGKKPARAKKAAARRRRPSRKKKLVLAAKRVTASALTHRGAQAPADTLGQWPTEDDEGTKENESSEDEIPPEYGGSE